MSFFTPRHLPFRWRMILIILLLVVCRPQAAMSQDEKVEFPSTMVTFGELVRTVEEQTHFLFAFNGRAFDEKQQITLTKRRLPVKDILAEMAESMNVSYMQKKRYIIIKPTPKKVQDTRWGYIARTGDIYNRTRVEDILAPGEYVYPIEIDSVAQSIKINPELNIPYYSNYLLPVRGKLVRGGQPAAAIKANFLYGAATLTPNIGVEFGLTDNSTLEFTAGWNQWNSVGTVDDNKKFNHWIVRGEYRHWFCERFDGHFLGGNLFYSRYNMSGHNVPLMFDDDKRYNGHTVGAAVTYGYNLPLAKRWNLEFHVGVGVAWMNYDRFNCKLCAERDSKVNRVYVGPTNAGINLVFMFR